MTETSITESTETASGTGTTGSAFATAAARYRPIFARIAAGALDRERNRTLPTEQIGWLKDAGFGAVRIPVELGGDGLTWPELTTLLIELAAADSNLPQALRAHIALVEENLVRRRRGEDRGVWLERFAAGQLAGNAWTEPGAGGTATILEDTPSGPTLTGRKYYTTGTIFADWIDVTARRPDGTDVSVVIATTTPGVRTDDDWDGFGQRLTGSGTTEFTAAAVDPANVSPFADRFPYQTALYQHLLLVALAGIGRAVVVDAAEQVRRRTRVFGHGNADLVRDDAQILAVVGEISAQAYAAEATTLRAAHSLQAAFAATGGAREREAVVATELETGQAQIVLSRLVPEAAGALFDALGASSTSQSRALDRHWRNARTVATHNPFIYKARIVGDREVNGTEPPLIWTIGEADADRRAARDRQPTVVG
ncbi:acyl-CoA dehydrogenase family protein [Tersicoccus sp. MR15.9]|uniref:acyl-CoA dehydrogenase family protein n=1 Tax=Tersicoccus mangrovi TaxID=3121635 RepID=UPI002FE51D2E